MSGQLNTVIRNLREAEDAYFQGPAQIGAMVAFGGGLLTLVAGAPFWLAATVAGLLMIISASPQLICINDSAGLDDGGSSAEWQVMSSYFAGRHLSQRKTRRRNAHSHCAISGRFARPNLVGDVKTGRFKRWNLRQRREPTRSFESRHRVCNRPNHKTVTGGRRCLPALHP